MVRVHGATPVTSLYLVALFFAYIWGVSTLAKAYALR